MKKTIIIAVVTLIMISFLLVQIPSAFSSELTSPEKTLTILEDMVGLDTSAYSTTLELHNQVLDYKGLPQEDVKYTLESGESKLEVICTFVNEKLHSINIYSNGLPHITQQATSTIEMAKDIINRYQTISGASYYGTLVSMLDNVEANKNVTKTFENVNLKVTDNANYTSYRWTYTVNGIEAPSKCVALKFEKGFLKYFIDNWSLYTIGSTDLNLSEEEAVRIAIDRTKNFSWNVIMGSDNPPVTVTEFNVVGVSETKLNIGNYASKKDARSGEPLTLYPGWRVKLYFDKLYLGNVYGVDVGIWADTGEINDIRTLKFLGDYSSNGDVNGNGDSIGLESNEEANNETSANILAITWIALLITIVLGAIIVHSKRKKKRSHELHNGPKANSLKLSGALLCLLISLTIFPMVMQTVNAGTYVMPLYGSTYEVEEDESDAAHSVINVWESYYNTWTDYTIYDLHGSDTEKDTVLDHADAFEDYFDHVAMFHYGHGGMNMSSPQHRDYFDDDGWDDIDDQIWDYEVWDKTGSSKHFFVVIWSCRQGDHVGGYNSTEGEYYGMPYTWFHGTPSSGDCFIGFEDASMPLTQQSANSTWCEYDLWLKQVGIRLSYSHATVIGALDAASNQYFDCDYDETELYLGFTAKWGEDPEDWGTGKMKIYGNSSIQVW